MINPVDTGDMRDRAKYLEDYAPIVAKSMYGSETAKTSGIWNLNRSSRLLADAAAELEALRTEIAALKAPTILFSREKDLPSTFTPEGEQVGHANLWWREPATPDHNTPRIDRGGYVYELYDTQGNKVASGTANSTLPEALSHVLKMARMQNMSEPAIMITSKNPLEARHEQD